METDVAAGRRAGRDPARRGPSLRRWALIGIGLEAALLAALTLWLFPSVWAVGRAVVDIDQSAGPDRGVNLSEVANHPEAMWGREVTVSARVEEVLGPRATLIGSDAPFVGDVVLVVGGADLGTLLGEPDAGPIVVGDVVRVTGEVRRFEPDVLARELGIDAASVARAGYDGEAALVARSVELDPPAHAGPGDKEFPSGSSGYEIGITIYDLTHHTDEHLGATVTVSDEIEEHLLTPHAFLLGDEALLAVSAEPRPELFVEATAYVTGEVRRFDLTAIEAELGVDLDDDLLRPYDGEPVILVRSLEVVA